MRRRNLAICSVALISGPSHAWNFAANMSRRDWFHKVNNFGILVSSASVYPLSADAVYKDPKTGILLPEEGEISAAIPGDWTGVDNPLAGDDKSSLGRLDTTPDSVFYADPRFVEHVDENAVQLMTDFISNRAVKNDDAVLDLCSSWTSHLDSNRVTLKRMAGLGMNEKELAANPALTDWTVSDLNVSPKLPFEDASFSVVLCQLSIDYLTKPLEVLKEVGRVLKPGEIGRAHV